jgi:hypothetical protein
VDDVASTATIAPVDEVEIVAMVQDPVGRSDNEDRKTDQRHDDRRKDHCPRGSFEQ